MNTIWTIGHSNRSFDEFLALLRAYKITLLVDVRRYPGSRKFPHFNKDFLEEALPKNKIEYRHLEALGGRRKVVPDSKNDAWRLDSFRGYADYMETDSFKTALKELKSFARETRTVYMCSEAVWWSCHRALISDILKVQGWEVYHILGLHSEVEHPYSSPAHIVNGQLSYKKSD